ncbi:MAG TPA: hypothetical protein VFQ77_16125 [Pseudonocardiaceae bacterium]|nr:hypothetical protein [Pseudonocardiaceae bacterium]
MSDSLDVSACPRCGRSDWSQTVQAIVDGQTTRTSGYGTSFGMGFANGRAVPVVASHRSSSTAQSPLAEMLDLPYPRKPLNKGVFGILVLVPTLLFAFAVVMIALNSIQEEGGGPAAGLGIFGQVVVLTIMTLIIFSPTLIVGIVLLVLHRRDRRMWDQQVQRWQQARRLWSTLRYCHRDHVVYRMPDMTIEPAMVRQVIYGQIDQQPGVPR